MTPYDIKETEKAMNSYEKIKKESEEKRANAEQQLINEARHPQNRFYFDALKDTITQETIHIKNAKDKICELKCKLIDAGVNC